MRPSARGGLVGLLAAAGVLLAQGTFGCAKPAPPRPSEGETAAPVVTAATPGQILRARELAEPNGPGARRLELVALAERVALAAENQPGPERIQTLKLAAALRKRSYRTSHSAADARAAIELGAGAATAGGGPRDCEPSLAAAALQAEVESDPATAYLKAYALSRGGEADRCAGSLRETLSLLSAYRPDPGKLAQIDRAASEAASAHGSVATPASGDGPVLVPLALAKGAAAAAIESIDAFGAKEFARVVVKLSAPATFRVGHVERPAGEAAARLFVDIERASRGAAPATKTVGGLVQRVRVGAQPGATRVVLDLETSAHRRVFYLPEPFRIVIDVATRSMRAEVERPAVAAGKRPVERVAIDPGHGGSDPGATGPGGLREKDVTLDIAHRVAPVLSRELAVAALLTRDDDRYVSLEERAARANAFHADVFVSIHCNASETPAGRGVQSYVLDVSRDDVAARVAARENSSTAAASAELGGVLAGLRASRSSTDSAHFATLIQQATMSSLQERYADTPNGGVLSAGFYVLMGAEMPSVLLEASFISNPVEESRLATADYRQKLADGIINAIRAYREGR
jgi:N-acetylmuramoyl-L-alanine amidase